MRSDPVRTLEQWNIGHAVAGSVVLPADADLCMPRKVMISRFVQILFLLLLPLTLPALAETEQPQARTARLEHAVLAPCCYTESVAVHQSEIAVKMRLEIAKWVAAGKSDQEILDTYVGLYGSEVLVDPRVMPRGWTPFFPWIVLILGVFVVAWLLRRWRALPGTETVSATEVPNLPDFEDE
jgi:cytochrome c-type biogenesis protein CcmH/NrfF